MNILIIDDEEVLQDILTVLIRKEGHTPLVAATGEEGLAMLEREEVDLILLDLMLPGVHGMEVLREVRRRDVDIVVVMITDFSSMLTSNTKSSTSLPRSALSDERSTT